MRGDALNVSFHACRCGEGLTIRAHLDVEIAGIQVEVVAARSRVLYDNSSDLRNSAEIHLEKRIGIGRTPFIAGSNSMHPNWRSAVDPTSKSPMTRGASMKPTSK